MSPKNIQNAETIEEKKTDEKKPVGRKFESLDDMIDVIEGDELRHVIGGGRPKTGPFA